MSKWIDIQKEGILIKVYIQPGAKENAVVGEFDQRLKIKIKSPPVDGKANQELIKFLSKLLGLSKSSIELIRGETSRKKDLLLLGIGESQLPKNFRE